VTDPAAPPPDALVPKYGEQSLADLMPSVLNALGVPEGRDVLGLPAGRRIAVLLVDGLGWELLRRHPAEAAFLSTLLPHGRALHAGFPATTATSLASLGTGLAPGEHGVLGYQVRVPGALRLLNALHWDPAVDPVTWQPHPTVFELAAPHGVAVTQVAPAALGGSGLTAAALRGAAYAAADAPEERLARAVEALAGVDRALVGVYYGDVDAAGHRHGVGSEEWRLELARADRFAEQLAGRLPAGSTLLVTADHGMVDVPADRRFDVDAEPGLADGVALLGGEGRARHVYAREGAAPDVLAAWQELLGDAAWVLPRDAAVAAGWFGPRVAEPFLPRIGDVVAALRGDAAVVASRQEPLESMIVGAHGSLTAAEQLVPLLHIAA